MAAIAIEVLCPALARETAAAFEARSRADLLVRGENGVLRLDCSSAPELRWTPENGATRSATVSDLSPDALLETLQQLLGTPDLESRPVPAPLPPTIAPPDVTFSQQPSNDVQHRNVPRRGAQRHSVPRSSPRHSSAPAPAPVAARPGPAFEFRAAADAQVWDQKVALGGHAGVAWQFPLLTPGLSGHVSRSLVSFNQIALYLVELRASADLHLLEHLRLGLSSGLGRPLTTSPVNFSASNNGLSPWFLEGGARLTVPVRCSKTVRLDAGAEWLVLSRRLRLFVDDTEAFDFQSKPGIFLELVLESSSL